MFDINLIMSKIKNFQKIMLQSVIDNDPMLAENRLLSQNKISEQIMIKFFLKIVKLGLIIFHICYFLGQVWFIIALVNMDDWEHNLENLTPEEFDSANHESFIGYFGLE